jgi:hypothetical protein
VQDPQAEPATGEAATQPSVTGEAVKQWLAAVEAAPGIAAEQKTALVAHYQKAADALAKAAESTERATGLAQKMESAPADLEAAQRALADSSAAPLPVPEVDSTATIEQAEQALSRAEAELVRLRTELEALESEEKNRADRRALVPALRTTEQAKRDELATKLQSKPQLRDPADPAFAEWVSWTAQVAASEAELRCLDLELPSYDARSRLMRTRLDLAHLQVDRQMQLLEKLRRSVAEVRTRQAEAERKKAEEAAREVADQHPDVKALADDNLKLIDARTGPNGLVPRIEAASKNLDELRAALSSTREKYEQTRRYIETVGLPAPRRRS